MNNNAFSKLMDFLDNLEEGHISYSLARHREDTVMVSVVVPGERWEVEFLADGSVEVEQFISSGEILGEEAFETLFQKHSDVSHEMFTTVPEMEDVAAIMGR